MGSYMYINYSCFQLRGANFTQVLHQPATATATRKAGWLARQTSINTAGHCIAMTPAVVKQAITMQGRFLRRGVAMSISMRCMFNGV